MTFKELIQHLEQEIEKREGLLETAKNPSILKVRIYKFMLDS